MNDDPHNTSLQANDDPERAQQCTLLLTDFTSNPVHGGENSQSKKAPTKKSIASPMSPRRRRAMERESMIEKVRHMVSSPFPFMVLILLVIMIVMIFIDIMPIAGTMRKFIQSNAKTPDELKVIQITFNAALTCISAIVMVVALVIGNHWRGQHIWGEVEEPKRGQHVDHSAASTSRALPGQNDEEHGSAADAVGTCESDSSNKGYAILQGKKNVQHRRSLTLNDAGRTKNSFAKNGESEVLVAKLSLVLPEEEDVEVMLPMTKEEKIDNINEFFEELFKSIDYSILLIFMGKRCNYSRINILPALI